MRKTLLTISVLALLLAACGTSQPGRPSPTVLGTEAPPAAPAATEAPAPVMPHY